ncbi:tRNA (5-methylaminomethyl-2-thiouridine)(34)-methyltransferase MnmD [Nitratifractor sp.]
MNPSMGQAGDSKRIVETADGSLTLYSERFDECYHSTRDGALKESLRKHVLPAFSLLGEREEVTILDICFGLGYNTLATLHHVLANDLPIRVRILSPEFDEALVRSLKDFDYPPEFEPLRPVIEAISEKLHYEDERFRIDVLIGDAREILDDLAAEWPSTLSFDIVYQDAFSPKKNPLLWTREYFAQIRRLASEDLILTTYSSATPVRMGLYENGFLLYEAPSEGVRPGTIASLRPLGLPPIDMELKKQRNPAAASLRDEDFLES